MIEKDTSAYSEARKKMWASRTPEQKREHARKMAIAKQRKMSFEERRKHALKMVEARKNK